MFNRTRINFAIAALFGAYCVTSLAQTQLDRVEITGSHIKRVGKEKALPVDVITANEIKMSGAKTVLELMKQVGSMGADGFNDTPGQNGFSKGVATASLRSLGSTSTLILLNGRRLAPSAYANPNNGTSTLYDLNSIPLSALERVEILKDGASAVYGSDAVGGVINFITKKDFSGVVISATTGGNDDGEFRKQNTNITGGWSDTEKKWNILLSADLTRRGATSERDGSNDIHADDYRAINLRLNPFNSSFSRLPFFTKEASPGNLNFPQTGSAARVVNVTAGCAPQQLLTGGAVHGISTQPLLGRMFCNFDLDQFNEVQARGEDTNLLARGTLRLSEIDLYSEIAYSESKRHFRAPPRTISGLSPTTNFLQGGLAGSFQPILEVGHPDNPFNNDAAPGRAAVGMRFEKFVGGTELTNTAKRALVGARGTLGEWDWDTGLLWNRSEREETRAGFLYLPTLRKMLGASGRPLAEIAADPTLSRKITDIGASEITQVDFKASREFGELSGGPLAMAFGGEVRRESIELAPDPEHAAGNILGVATTAVAGGRTVQSAWAEVQAPVLKTLTLDVAGRLDKYPDLKRSFVPKFGAKWTPVDEFAVRSSYGRGFRAPAVSQVSPGGAQFFLNNLVDPVRCQSDGVTPKPGAEDADCKKSVSGVGGQNPALTPEHSKSWTLGLLFSPNRSFDMSLDWWRIVKIGEVALGEAQDALDHPDRFPPGTIVRDTNPALLLNGQAGTGPLLSVATPWMNQGKTDVSGVDFDLRGRAAMETGTQLNAFFKGTYNLKYLREEKNGDTAFNVVGTNGGLADFATSVGDIPRLKFRMGGGATTPEYSVNLAMNWVSAISQKRLYNGSDNPPSIYSGTTCHWGGPNNDAKVATGTPVVQRVLGVAPTATNGRDLYINRYPDCKVPEWITFDFAYTYTGFKDLELSLFINNFTDVAAPYQPASNTSSTVVDGYNSGLHSNTGRYWTVTARYKF